MQLISILKEVLEYLKPLSKFHQSFHFASWIVPLFVFGFWYYSLLEERSLEKMQTNITLIPMQSVVYKDGHISNKKGTLVFVKDSRDEYKIPLKDSAFSEIWTTLDKETMRMNDNKIFISKNGVINVSMPLYGQSQSVGMVIEQELGIPNTQANTLDSLFPMSDDSKTLLISVLFSFSFGYGLIFSRIGWWHYEFS